MLIADDHELVRQGMRAIFQSGPQWVVCGEATTGRQALTMTLETKPDLVDVRRCRRVSPFPLTTACGTLT